MKVVAKPIQMIAGFNKDGSINPIRFKIEDDGEKVIKIDRIIKSEQERLAGNIIGKFTCVSCINGMEKIFELKYYSNSSKWILFEI